MTPSAAPTTDSLPPADVRERVRRALARCWTVDEVLATVGTGRNPTGPANEVNDADGVRLILMRLKREGTGEEYVQAQASYCETSAFGEEAKRVEDWLYVWTALRNRVAEALGCPAGRVKLAIFVSGRPHFVCPVPAWLPAGRN